MQQAGWDYILILWRYKRANECMNFIVQSANEHGFLAEQSNSDLNEKWVIGLAWSHAIFIELLVFLKKKF